MPIRFLSLSVQAISKYNHTQKFEGKKEERKHIGTSEKKNLLFETFSKNCTKIKKKRGTYCSSISKKYGKKKRFI